MLVVLTLAASLGLSCLLALPRLERHDYSATPLWRIERGAYHHDTDAGPGLFDAAGVLVVDYGETIGVRHSPTAIAQHAIGLTADWADERSRRAFWVQVEWLRRNAVWSPRLGVIWPHDYDWPINRQRAPWISSLTQGNAISALTRAYRRSGDTAYATLARLALRAFDVDEREGGVMKTVAPGVVVYEEYPNSEYVVLDGWLNGLAGVQELYLATGDTTAKRILERGVRSAAVLLPRFTGRWSLYYSSRRDLPSPAYFSLSYNSLRFLAAYHPQLGEVEQHWRRFIPSGFWVRYARVYYQAFNWRRLALFGIPPLTV